MSNKPILAIASPVTQTAAAVEQLIALYNHGQTPEEMPPFFRLSAEMVLVQDGKGSSYYVTTPRTCSCPSATYRPGKACKHRAKYFPAQKPDVKPSRAGAKAGEDMSREPFKPFLESDCGMSMEVA